MNDILYIVIPAYNESDNIIRIVEDWYSIIERCDGGSGKSRLVIIDDGSKDDTYEKMEKLAVNNPLFIPLTKDNEGHGPTVLYGYRYAIDNLADYIFQTDSDGQTNPEEFWYFWDKRNEYDAVIGNRSNRKDGKSRVIVEKVLLVLLKIIFGVNIPDSNAPFRLMKSELVEKYIGLMPYDFNLPNVIFTTLFKYYNENIKFVNISFEPRQGGTNSINIRKIVKIGIKAIGDFAIIKKRLRANEE